MDRGSSGTTSDGDGYYEPPQEDPFEGVDDGCSRCGDYNDMDHDGRTSDDVDADHDGRYECR